MKTFITIIATIRPETGELTPCRRVEIRAVSPDCAQRFVERMPDFNHREETVSWVGTADAYKTQRAFQRAMA